MRAWSRKGLITGSTINEVTRRIHHRDCRFRQVTRDRELTFCDNVSCYKHAQLCFFFCNYFKFITLRSAVVADPSPFAGRRPSPRAPPLSPP